MKKIAMIAALVAVFAVSSVYAEGVPSQSKLNSLGLSSLNVASDAAGQEVRGEGFGAASFTFNLAVTADGGANTQTAVGTQSSVFGQDPQTLDAVSFGGTGFGGFADNTAPDFSTYVSTPITINAAFGGVTSVASIQGFSWGIGK